MDISKKIVTQIPLASLWTKEKELNAQRINTLDQPAISQILKSSPVRFVIANLGDNLLWIDTCDCYKVYKNNIRQYVVTGDKIYLDGYEVGFCYLASLWEDGSDIPIILLEKIH